MQGAFLKKWDTDTFRSPGIQYSPIYSWVWNGKCSHEETDRQLEEMQRLGIRAFYIIPEPKNFRPNSIPTEMEPDYLTAEYFNEYMYALRSAQKRGMKCWLYDEGGWPSGGACGKVIERHPETETKCVQTTEFTVCKGTKYIKQNAEALATFTNDGEYITEESTFNHDTACVEYYLAPEHRVDRYADITHPDTARHFLNITHEAYKKAAGDDLEKLISAIFTDEPSTPHFLQSAVDDFEKKYGYSILPYIPLLGMDQLPEFATILNFDNVPKVGAILAQNEKNANVLNDWYDLCSHLYCDRFLKVCKKWANDHGLQFTGHIGGDDILEGWTLGHYYQLMRALRCFDIPGVDVIWRQIYPGERYEYEPYLIVADNGFFPRYASSAAAQNGTDCAMSESFGVYGNGLTYEEMRFCIGFQAIRGINIFNLMLFSYARHGHILAQEQPAFEEKYACYKHLDVFNAYIERLAYVCSLGERVCYTALYYPISNRWRRENVEIVSAQYDALGRMLEDRRIDFDIIDDDVFAESTSAEEGCIRMGKACYTQIVIPEQAYLPPKTKAALERFCAGGGKVYYSAEEIPGVELEGFADKVRMMHRILENGEIYCFFNENVSEAAFDFPVPDKNIYWVSMEEGRVLPCSCNNGVAHLTLVSGETGAVLITDECLKTEETSPACDNRIDVSAFTIRRKTGCVLKETGCELVEFDDTSKFVELGDWSSEIGNDFSGSCVYKTNFEFDVIPPCDCVLDLGKVCYTCEITLNGEKIATKLMPPYRCALPSGLLKNHNELEIIVSNTMANQFVYTNIFQRYEQWQLSPYYKKQIDFMKDSLPSGLFGPVRILYANSEK